MFNSKSIQEIKHDKTFRQNNRNAKYSPAH
jgi:hypothetical protein